MSAALTRRRAALCAVCLLAAWASAPSHGADATGAFSVDGPGTHGCNRLLSASEGLDNSGLAVYAAWATGVSSAFNLLLPETYDITPWQTPELIAAKLVAYCRRNAEARVADAVFALISALEPDRLTSDSPLVQLRANGRAVSLYRETLREVATALRARGHEVATTEAGEVGAAISAALATFQADEALPTTGLPDQATLNALFR